MKLSYFYYLTLVISVVLIFSLYPHLRTCPNEAWGYQSPKNIEVLVFLTYLFLFFARLLFLYDIYSIIKGNLKSKDWENLQTFWIIILVVLTISRERFHNASDLPNVCDKIIGPGDSGIFLVTLSISIISTLRLYTLNKNKSKQ